DALYAGSQRRFHEAVEIAIQYGAGVRRLVVGPQILHHLVGLQHIAANLVPPADLGLRRRLGIGRRFALLELLLVEARLQHLHRRRTVLVLAALLLAGHHDPGRNVGDADRRVRRVDVLAARAGGAVGVDLEV